MEILKHEMREALCMILLDNFSVLAQHAPQLWTRQNITVRAQ
jgi:hypothetical protein